MNDRTKTHIMFAALFVGFAVLIAVAGGLTP